MFKNCCLSDEADIEVKKDGAPASSKIDRTVAVAWSRLCPTCAQKGRKVDTITVKAMLNVSLMTVQDGAYLFCRNAVCPVVYFSVDRKQIFTKDQIRVPVHQKEPDDENVPICYCFYHSPATIRAELQTADRSTAIKTIQSGIKAGQCACEIRNPQGRCCLSNVHRVVQQLIGS